MTIETYETRLEAEAAIAALDARSGTNPPDPRRAGSRRARATRLWTRRPLRGHRPAARGRATFGRRPPRRVSGLIDP